MKSNESTKKRRVETFLWSPSEFLTDSHAAAAYLEAAFEDGDPQLICAALGDIAKAKGMTKLASDSGLSRESLYKALSQKGNPGFANVLKVLQAFNVQLRPAVATTDEPHLREIGNLWNYASPSPKEKCYLLCLHESGSEYVVDFESLDSDF